MSHLAFPTQSTGLIGAGPAFGSLGIGISPHPNNSPATMQTAFATRGACVIFASIKALAAWPRGRGPCPISTQTGHRRSHAKQRTSYGLLLAPAAERSIVRDHPSGTRNIQANAKRKEQK